jgi:hypothetical protein
VTGADSDDESDVDPWGDESDHELPLGEDAEDNEVGIDEALHQREIALRYYQLRQNLGTGSRERRMGQTGMPYSRIPFHTHAYPSLQEVALDATLAIPNKRLASSTSRFMAPRISDQAMAAVVPQGIESEIKPAKVMDGQLASVDGTRATRESVRQVRG